jgi:hypothetical protein
LLLKIINFITFFFLKKESLFRGGESATYIMREIHICKPILYCILLCLRVKLRHKSIKSVHQGRRGRG